MLTPHARQIALLCLTTLVACKTHPPSSQERAPDLAQQPTVDNMALPSEELTALIARVEILRDLPLERPLTLKAHDTIPKDLIQATPLPAHVSTAYKALAAHLDAEVIGTADAPLMLPAPPSHALALYEPDTHTLHHLARHDEAPELLRGAIVRAIVQAIDYQRAMPPAATLTLDAWMAASAARAGDAVLVAIVQELEQESKKTLDVAAIAQSPEMIWARPKVQTQLGQSFYGDRHLLRTTHSFTEREGAHFIAAMIRSHGWSGAEVAMSMPPSSTAQIIDPERWLAGNQDAAWALPDSWSNAQQEAGWALESQGQVGAAWTTMWMARARTLATKKHQPDQPLNTHERTLSELTDQALQVLPSSWQADRWQVWRKEAHTKFLWTSQWDAPTSTSYVGRMLGASITAMHQLQPNLSMRCAVSHEGIQVAVLCSDDASITPTQLDEQSATLARKARVSYRTGQDNPLHYKPSTAQRLVKSAAVMTLDEYLVWRDPELGLMADLSALSGKNPQLTDTGLIRWYAAHEGITIQLSAEPINPLKPDFSSKAYAAELASQIIKSLPGSKSLGTREVEHATLGTAYALGVEAVFEQTPHQLYLWHVRHDDVVLTLSVNAPTAKAPGAKALTEKIFKLITPLPQ